MCLMCLGCKKTIQPTARQTSRAPPVEPGVGQRRSNQLHVLGCNTSCAALLNQQPAQPHHSFLNGLVRLEAWNCCTKRLLIAQYAFSQLRGSLDAASWFHCPQLMATGRANEACLKLPSRATCIYIYIHTALCWEVGNKTVDALLPSCHIKRFKRILYLQLATQTHRICFKPFNAGLVCQSHLT